LGRLERRAGAEVVDHAFERLNLRRQRAGRGTIAAVLFLQARVRGTHAVELHSSAPARAEADEHGQYQDAHHRDDSGTQTNRDAADYATRAISDDNRVASAWHHLQVKPSGTAMAVGSFRRGRKGI